MGRLGEGIIWVIASCPDQTVGGAEASASGAYWERNLFRPVTDSILAEWRGTLFGPVRSRPTRTAQPSGLSFFSFSEGLAARVKLARVAVLIFHSLSSGVNTVFALSGTPRGSGARGPTWRNSTSGKGSETFPFHWDENPTSRKSGEKWGTPPRFCSLGRRAFRFLYAQ